MTKGNCTYLLLSVYQYSLMVWKYNKTEAPRKEIETLKSWQQEVQEKQFELEMLIS